MPLRWNRGQRNVPPKRSLSGNENNSWRLKRRNAAGNQVKSMVGRTFCQITARELLKTMVGTTLCQVYRYNGKSGMAHAKSSAQCAETHFES